MKWEIYGSRAYLAARTANGSAASAARTRPAAKSASGPTRRAAAELAVPAPGFVSTSTVQPLSPVSVSVSEEETTLNVTEEPAAPLVAIVDEHVITRVPPLFVSTAPFVIVKVVPVSETTDEAKLWPPPSVQRASAWSAAQICVDATSVNVPPALRFDVVVSAKTTLVGVSFVKSVLGVAATQTSDVAPSVGACV